MVRACARLTTVARLRAAMAARRKLRWRAQLGVVLDDVRAGCHCTLEVAYLRGVERCHRLPTATRQAMRARPGGRWYDDLHYAAYRTVVEVDGAPAHPADVRGRDRRRDNAAVAAGLTVLRYDAADVVGRTCEVALQLATVLIRNGWRGRPRPCGPQCVIAKSKCTGSDTSSSRSRGYQRAGQPRAGPQGDPVSP